MIHLNHRNDLCAVHHRQCMRLYVDFNKKLVQPVPAELVPAAGAHLFSAKPEDEVAVAVVGER